MNDNSPLKRGMPGKLVPFVAVIFHRSYRWTRVYASARARDFASPVYDK